MKKLFAPFLAILTLAAAYGVPAYADDNTVIYLVRHAEKLADSDPGLTDKGVARADALAGLLAAKGITQVFSTDYKRTRMTAAPTAKQSGVEITLYDPRTLKQFAEQLAATAKAAKGNILVVGHSNTTPVVTSFLTNTDYPMLNEDQYDHLYIVRRAAGGSLKANIEYFNP